MKNETVCSYVSTSSGTRECLELWLEEDLYNRRVRVGPSRLDVEVCETSWKWAKRAQKRRSCIDQMLSWEATLLRRKRNYSWVWPCWVKFLQPDATESGFGLCFLCIPVPRPAFSWFVCRWLLLGETATMLYSEAVLRKFARYLNVELGNKKKLGNLLTTAPPL